MQSDTLPKANALMAVGQIVGVNVLVNRFDAVVQHKEWAYVGTRVWERNLRLGWAWDEDAFATNVFAHPYNGSIYFNAGRANGLGFFQSVPLVLLGSWSWEYFAETERPSLNDFLMTSAGGIALGEMFYRVGTTIRDNTASGTTRTLRELAALPFDPTGGLNRLVRGQWNEVGRNPRTHDPKAFMLRTGVGMRFAKGLVNDSVARMGTIVADLIYGDQFAGPYRTPFDVFSIRLVLSSQGKGLSLLAATGRLWGRDLNDSTNRIRHQIAVNQRYDYLNNPAQSYGTQSVELGVDSRWRIGPKGSKGGFGLRTSLFLDAIILGAIDAPGTGVGARDYDFGPGAGLRWEVGVDRHAARFIVLQGRAEYIHTVSGAAADHLVNVSGVELTIPLTNRLGLSVQTNIFDRESHYASHATDRRDYPEGRFMLVWTKAGGKP